MSSLTENEKLIHAYMSGNTRGYKRAYYIKKENKAVLIFERDGELVKVYPHLDAAP